MIIQEKEIKETEAKKETLEEKLIKLSDAFTSFKELAEKEKKVWEKAKTALQKSFLKIEAPVKDTYVLFQVNKELGLARIEEKKTELSELAKTALEPAQELTRKINSSVEAPQGFIKGTIYKLKKKFL